MSKKVVNIIFKVGVIGVIVSAILLVYSIIQLNEASDMLSALGGNSSVWLDEEETFELIRNISIFTFIVCGILAASGQYLKSDSNTKSETSNVINETEPVIQQDIQIDRKGKLKELKELFENGLITEEEYNKKRQTIIDQL